MPNYRRVTRGLDRNAVIDLNDAWHHARKIGWPLNVMVTLRPLQIEEISPTDRTAIWNRLLNKLGAYARYRGFRPFTAAWARESNRDGTGEHLHVLMHVSLKQREHFEETVSGWYEGPIEIDVIQYSARTQAREAARPEGAQDGNKSLKRLHGQLMARTRMPYLRAVTAQ
jgi:hypothetical protein